MTVIPFPNRCEARRISKALRWGTIEMLRAINNKLGNEGFELCAEELIEAVNAILQHERAKKHG